MLRGGLHAGPVIAPVIDIGAVGDDGHAQPGGDLFELGVKLRLAVKAAIGRVLQVPRLIELVGGNYFVANADQPSQFLSLLQFAGGQAGAHARYGDRVFAQRQLRRFGHHGAVDSAGEGNGATLVAANGFHQPVAQQMEFGRVVRHGTREAKRANCAGTKKLDATGPFGPAASSLHPKQARVLHRNAVAVRI